MEIISQDIDAYSITSNIFILLRSVDKKPDGLASIVGAESIHEFMYVTASYIGSMVDIEHIVLIS